MVIISLVIISITTIITCPRIIARYYLYVHRRLFLYSITGSARGAPTTPSCDAHALSALCSPSAFRPLQIWVGLGGLRGTEGVTPSGLVAW